MSASIDNGSDTYVLFLIGGAFVQLLVTIAVAVWDLRRRYRSLLMRLFVHFILLLTLVILLPLVVEFSWDSTYSHYRLSPEEAAQGFNFGPEGLVWGILLSFGIAGFVVYEFVNIVIWFVRRLKDVRGRVDATGGV